MRTPQIVGLLVILAPVLLGSGFALWQFWIAHEERKARDRRVAEIRQELSLLAAHRIPKPFHERAAQGFDRNGGNHAA